MPTATGSIQNSHWGVPLCSLLSLKIYSIQVHTVHTRQAPHDFVVNLPLHTLSCLVSF
ncbi:uncharacterized protein DS421_3g92280 [Arachis hypogaea]|nr:uncharacterized protein DS421_3g92280 [Arachis hypogaea]